jgi:membrane-associated phospholipid phosphatase
MGVQIFPHVTISWVGLELPPPEYREPRWLRRSPDGIPTRVEVPRRDRLPAPRSLLHAAAITAAISGLAILTFDQPVARAIAGYRPLGFWDRGLDLLEWTIGLPIFSWVSGIVLVLGMIITSAVPRWRGQAPAWMLLAATHILSRIATLEIKLATGRLRPYEWLAKGSPDDTFLWHDAVSFPSGHVTLFASIVIPLAALLGRKRPVLAAVVLLPMAFSMTARVVANAHFVSDVFAGATLCCVIAWICGLIIRPMAPAA